MLHAGMLAKIRRMRFRAGMSLREVARRTEGIQKYDSELAAPAGRGRAEDSGARGGEHFIECRRARG